MRFLQSIIKKTATPIEERVLSHQQDDVEVGIEARQEARKASYQDSDPHYPVTPKFSRSAQRHVRKPAVITDPQASLGDLLENWKKDAKQFVPPTTAPKKLARKTSKPVERVKTRLLGFDDMIVPETFDKIKPAHQAASTRFPTGWLIVVDGPGRGESFTLSTGMSQIGRDQDQTVQLDFGDAAISRSNHAAIVYDTETHSFIMGHGGKANIVRINDKPLITNQTLKTDDVIRIGETSLQLVVFSTPKFNWAGAPILESEDVATS